MAFQFGPDSSSNGGITTRPASIGSFTFNSPATIVNFSTVWIYSNGQSPDVPITIEVSVNGGTWAKIATVYKRDTFSFTFATLCTTLQFRCADGTSGSCNYVKV